MATLTAASRQLFARKPDERFDSLDALWAHARTEKEKSVENWQLPGTILPIPTEDSVALEVLNYQKYGLTDWSFGQLCKLAQVSKDTLNKLTPATAAKALVETLPTGKKPVQLYTRGGTVRSIHGSGYTRLHNFDVISVVKEFATDFTPPPKGFNGATGLYHGEEDCFLFQVDPACWVEIEGENFAPGFFIHNSEVGRRSVGITTFWFQEVCGNHIVWGAKNVQEVTFRHTSKVHECLNEIRKVLEVFVQKRDERKDGFFQVIKKAMTERLGDDADEVLKVLGKKNIPLHLAREAVKTSLAIGTRFSIFSIVDYLTRQARELQNAGDRVEADIRAASLLNLITEDGPSAVLAA